MISGSSELEFKEHGEKSRSKKNVPPEFSFPGALSDVKFDGMSRVKCFNEIPTLLPKQRQ